MGTSLELLLGRICMENKQAPIFVVPPKDFQTKMNTNWTESVKNIIWIYFMDLS